MGAVVRLRPEEPAPAPIAQGDPFDQAWMALTTIMRRRTEGRADGKLKKLWLTHAKLCGSEERLLAALKNYIANDKDVARTGGPGLGPWLRACKWEHWTPIEAVDAKPPGPTLDAPAGFRERFVELLGEAFVRSWIDQCRWDGARLIAPRQFTVDKLQTEFRRSSGRLAALVVELEAS